MTTTHKHYDYKIASAGGRVMSAMRYQAELMAKCTETLVSMLGNVMQGFDK